MNTYTIEPDGKSGFQVRETGPDGEPAGGHITTGFPTREVAQAWIDNHKAAMAAGERWERSAPGYARRQ